MQNNVSFEYPVGAVYDIRLVMIQNTSKYRIVVIGQECTELEENYLYIIYLFHTIVSNLRLANKFHLLFKGGLADGMSDFSGLSRHGKRGTSF